jgi:hypothetical protein
MKFMILFLILAISIQPLQAGFCDMEAGQDITHNMEHADDGNHDCCDSDDSGSLTECESMMHCGSCHAAYSSLPTIYKFNAGWVTHYFLGSSSGGVFPSHSAPPFRPPIA